MADAATNQELFVEGWQVYRKMVDNDYLFHRDAYGCLRQILDTERNQPFSLLDVACGDAGSSAAALCGTQVSRYDGIDMSRQALDIAGRNLVRLNCPVRLTQADFPGVLRARSEPADVVWISLSLHHLRAPGKLDVMRDIRRIVGETGLFLIYEDTSPDGESRDGWLQRWDDQKELWTAYSAAEWQYVNDHVHQSDFPETDGVWRELGHAAGFGRVRQRYASPTGLLRLYSFEA